MAKAEQCTVEKDILAASELWVKANTQLDKRHQRATHLDTSAIGGVDAGNRLEQCALTRAIAPNNTKEITLVDGKVDILKWRKNPIPFAPLEEVNELLLDARTCLQRDLEGLGEVIDNNDWLRHLDTLRKILLVAPEIKHRQQDDNDNRNKRYEHHRVCHEVIELDGLMRY